MLPKIQDRYPPLDKLEFLPTERLRKTGSSASGAYADAQPFPHIILDDLFNEQILYQIVAEFPKPADAEWIKYKNIREVKLASNRDEHFGPMTRLMLYHLNSAPFLMFLSEVTGIPGLISDSYFDGGGMHQIQTGGKLAVHADFNKHK